MGSIRPVLIACCGNADGGDDAFGPRVAAALRDHARCCQALADADVADLGSRPWELLDHLPGRRCLLLVDAAVLPDARPGRLLEFEWFDPARPPLVSETLLSTHALGLTQQLALAAMLDLLPDAVHLLAVTIRSATPGREPSSAVLAQVQPAAQRARELVRAWSR